MTTSPGTTTAARAGAEGPSDEDLVRRVQAGDEGAFEGLMRRHNQRLFRAARGIVKDPAEAEDVLQQAYLNVYTHLHQYDGRGSVAGWLTRIAVREALARYRRRARSGGILGESSSDRLASPDPDPEQAAASGELRRDLEATIDALADTYRPVFVMREVAGLSTSETAEALGLGEDVVKTRLHRARAMLRAALAPDGQRPRELFRFGFERCDRVVAAVLAAVRAARPAAAR